MSPTGPAGGVLGGGVRRLGPSRGLWGAARSGLPWRAPVPGVLGRTCVTPTSVPSIVWCPPRGSCQGAGLVPAVTAGGRYTPAPDCGSALSGRGTGQRPPSGGGMPTLRVAATGGPMGPHVCKTPRSCTPRTHAFAVSGTPQGSWAEPSARLRWHAHGGAPARPDLTGGRVMTHVTPAAAAVIFCVNYAHTLHLTLCQHCSFAHVLFI